MLWLLCRFCLYKAIHLIQRILRMMLLSEVLSFDPGDLTSWAVIV